MEKRSSIRKAIQRPLHLEIKAGVTGPIKAARYGARSMDICRHGLGLITDCFLKAGDVLTLEFPVSEEHIPLPVLASVVWSMRDGDNWRAGLRFLL